MCKHGTLSEVILFEPSCESGLTEEQERDREKRLGLKKDGDLIDSCIAPLIQMLSNYKIETWASCCGHGKLGYSNFWIYPQHIKIVPRWTGMNVIYKFIIKALSFIIEKLAYGYTKIVFEVRFPYPNSEYFMKDKQSKIRINSKVISKIHPRSLI